MWGEMRLPAAPAGRTYCVWRRRRSGLPCERCSSYLRAEDTRADSGRVACTQPGCSTQPGLAHPLLEAKTECTAHCCQKQTLCFPIALVKTSRICLISPRRNRSQPLLCEPRPQHRCLVPYALSENDFPGRWRGPLPGCPCLLCFDSPQWLRELLGVGQKPGEVPSSLSCGISTSTGISIPSTGQ